MVPRERDGRDADVRREVGSLHGNPIAAPADPTTMNILVNYLPKTDSARLMTLMYKSFKVTTNVLVLKPL